MTGTYGDMKTRIADELARSDLTSQIALAVLSSVKHYERRRFYFNEGRASTFSTVAGQEFYGSADLADIPNYLDIDTLRITISSNSNYTLDPKTYEYLDEINVGGTTTRGQPVFYSNYAQQIRLYPVPDAVYTMRISGVKALTALSADADTNAWTTDAEDLIRHRAKWDIYANVTGDIQQAGVMKQNEQEALTALLGVNTMRAATGFLTATQF